MEKCRVMVDLENEERLNDKAAERDELTASINREALSREVLRIIKHEFLDVRGNQVLIAKHHKDMGEVVVRVFEYTPTVSNGLPYLEDALLEILVKHPDTQLAKLVTQAVRDVALDNLDLHEDDIE